MKKKSLFFLFMVISYIGFSQNPNKEIDSLIQSLRILNEDTFKVNTLNSLSRKLSEISEFNKAISYAREALSLSEHIGFKKGIAQSYARIGTSYYGMSNYKEALKNALASLKIQEEMGSKKGMASSYTNIGNIYFEQNNKEEALKNYLIAKKIAEEIGDKGGNDG